MILCRFLPDPDWRLDVRKYLVAVAAMVACAVTVWAQTPAKKGYIVAQIDVSNAAQYAEYAKLSPGVIEKFGGRFLARAGRTATLEGRPGASRIVVLEFPSYEKAQEFYNSPDYQALRKKREGAATVQFIVVEGPEPRRRRLSLRAWMDAAIL